MHAPDPARAYRDTNRGLFLVMLFALAWAFGLLALDRLVPDRVPACASLRLLHVPCPLCGMTRGMLALMQGHWSRALSFNPLTPAAAALLLLELAYRGAGLTQAGAARLLPWRRWDYWLHIGMLWALMGYTTGSYASRLRP